MKSKGLFDHNILKINKNELLSTNKHELCAILWIIWDDKKQYSMKKKTLNIRK